MLDVTANRSLADSYEYRAWQQQGLAARIRRGNRPASLLTAIRRFMALVRLWHARSTQRRDLAALDVHLLRDIGLTREHVAQECAKPFWR